MPLVFNPGIRAHTVTRLVETSQVAPTILQILRLDPSALDAVRIEGSRSFQLVRVRPRLVLPPSDPTTILNHE
jgi:hypothetical protein